jgi:hypothetical protein
MTGTPICPEDRVGLGTLATALGRCSNGGPWGRTEVGQGVSSSKVHLGWGPRQ